MHASDVKQLTYLEGKKEVVYYEVKNIPVWQTVMRGQWPQYWEYCGLAAINVGFLLVCLVHYAVVDSSPKTSEAPRVG
jgi:hypothetical protein